MAVAVCTPPIVIGASGNMLYVSRRGARRSTLDGAEAFLFSTWRKEADGLHVYGWSGANRYCQLASIDFVAFGSGGHFGLWLGKELRTGSTGRCATFDNEPLTEHHVEGGLDEPHRGDSAFDVQEVQLWGFV